ncbi:aminoglycoside phosphotransferase [Actinoplanes sp. N902-109]|nr:hypothetical protein [Actinoplanes sp. N902-109]AGL17367.1 aminoglycoside phosphotransferase [Actinoplanes sp. N902-109]
MTQAIADITAELVRALVREQHPDLADRPVRLGAGDPAYDLRRAPGWAMARAFSGIIIGDNGVRGLPGGKPSWGPPGQAALRRLLATRR